MLNITEIMSALIALAVAVLTTFIIPAIRQKMNADEFAGLLKWTKIAVQAAEMIYNDAGLGKEKKRYVEQFLTNKGYVLDAAEMDAAIESAVLELKASVANENG